MNDQPSAPRMPVVEVSGDPAERGRQHGEQLRAEIAACIDIYDTTFGLSDDELADRAGHFERVTRAWDPELAAEIDIYDTTFGLSDDELADRAGHFERVTRAWDPELAAEIDAIATGADQPAHWIWALNARSEIMSYTGQQVSECTSVWSPSTSTLAQNWDWIRELEPLTRLLDVTHPDGHRVVTVTEPGIVGKVGLSSAGIAVGLNFLYSPEVLDGVPVHVLLRSLLDARGLDEVEGRLDTAGCGRSAHVFLATAGGVGSSIEYTGTAMLRRDSSSDPLLHTNHFVNGEADNVPTQGAGTANSESRYRRSVDLVTERGVDSIDAVRALLDDRGDETFPICRAWAPSDSLPGIYTGTVCAIVMRLADRTLDVRLGPEPSGAWQSHRV